MPRWMTRERESMRATKILKRQHQCSICTVINLGAGKSTLKWNGLCTPQQDLSLDVVFIFIVFGSHCIKESLVINW